MHFEMDRNMSVNNYYSLFTLELTTTITRYLRGGESKIPCIMQCMLRPCKLPWCSYARIISLKYLFSLAQIVPFCNWFLELDRQEDIAYAVALNQDFLLDKHLRSQDLDFL